MKILLVLLLLIFQSVQAASEKEIDGHKKATTSKLRSGYWYEISKFLVLDEVSTLSGACRGIRRDILGNVNKALYSIDDFQSVNSQAQLWGHPLRYVLLAGILVSAEGVCFGTIPLARNILAANAVLNTFSTLPYNHPMTILITALSRGVPEIQAKLLDRYMRYLRPELGEDLEDVQLARIADIANTGNLAARRRLLEINGAATTCDAVPESAKPENATIVSTMSDREYFKHLADNGDERAQVLMLMGALVNNGKVEIFSTGDTVSEEDFFDKVRNRIGWGGNIVRNFWDEVVGYGIYDFEENPRLVDLVGQCNSVATTLYAEAVAFGIFGYKQNPAELERLSVSRNLHAQRLLAKAWAYGNYGFKQNFERLKALAATGHGPATDEFVKILNMGHNAVDMSPNERRAYLSPADRKAHILHAANDLKIPAAQKLLVVGLAYGEYGFAQDLNKLEELAKERDPVVIEYWIDHLKSLNDPIQIMAAAKYSPEAQAMWIEGLYYGRYGFLGRDFNTEEYWGPAPGYELVVKQFIGNPLVQEELGCRDFATASNIPSTLYPDVRKAAFADLPSFVRLWNCLRVADQLDGLWRMQTKIPVA